MTDNPLLDYAQAAAFLTEELGREVTPRMLKHARERKPDWPFFLDPLSRKIVIRKNALLSTWRQAESGALTHMNAK